jgi:DNA-directed RNA polymerase subunit RPC12/RpoP
MAEYIKRTDVMKICEGYSEHCFSSSDAKGQDIADRILDDVVEIPTADVEEVKHGYWIEQEDMFCAVYYTCSNCRNDWTTIDGTPQENFMNYCPNCGAKMDGKDIKVPTTDGGKEE